MICCDISIIFLDAGRYGIFLITPIFTIFTATKKHHITMSDLIDDCPKYRLLLFYRANGLFRNRDIERSIGVSNGYFNNMNGGINTDVLTRVVNAYPNINLRWLLLGTGKMNIAPTDGLHVAEDGVTPLSEDDFNVPVRVFLSTSTISMTDSTLPPRWRMLPKRLVKGHEDMLVCITDESLLPEYSIGDYILFTPSSLPAAEEKKLMLCTFPEGKTHIGITSLMDDEGTIISIEAINPDRTLYPRIICAAKDIAKCYVASSAFNF
jgi:hypothetical protein